MTMGQLELEMMQVLPFVLTAQIGDCGAAGVPLSLAHILDFADPGERIGVIDYGSGAGCDAWSLVTTDVLAERRPQSGLVIQKLEDKILVDYATMLKFEHKLIKPANQLTNFY
jgi:hydroxymethylglutaryl-CoA synthase